MGPSEENARQRVREEWQREITIYPRACDKRAREHHEAYIVAEATSHMAGLVLLHGLPPLKAVGTGVAQTLENNTHSPCWGHVCLDAFKNGALNSRMLMGTHPASRHRGARAGRQRTNNKRKHTAVNQARMCEGGVAIP